MSEKTYATAIECMDGAVQGAARKHMRAKYGVRFVDAITQPGIVKILAENTNRPRIELIKEMISISVVAHKSRAIAIAAHYNCLGNPATKEKQLKQLPRAKKTVEEMIRGLNLHHLDIEIVLLWVNQNYLPEEVHISTKGRVFSRELVFATCPIS